MQVHKHTFYGRHKMHLHEHPHKHAYMLHTHTGWRKPEETTGGQFLSHMSHPETDMLKQESITPNSHCQEIATAKCVTKLPPVKKTKRQDFKNFSYMLRKSKHHPLTIFRLLGSKALGMALF